MDYESIADVGKALRAKKVSSEELARECLRRVEQGDGRIKSVVALDAELTLARAKQADEALAKGEGEGKPLLGVPFAVKDNFCHEGWRSSCGSKMLERFVSPYTATVVKNLEDAGMVAAGRVNMDEFAMGSTCETSHFGATRNPWDVERAPGGSSGGSAAAVAAGFYPASIGSDTGGSIRQPASHCGVTGLKPTYGVNSRWGLVAYASSFDQAGPLGRTAEDCALMLNAMAGFDPKDSTSCDRPKEDYARLLGQSVKGMKVGVPKEWMEDGLDADVRKTVEAAADLLRSLGAEVVEASLPRADLCIPAYYVLASAEASANLSRFDGVRYGHRSENAKTIEDLYVMSRTEGFGPEVKRRILIGAYVLSAGFYDAYYLKAAKLRRLIAQDFAKAFETCDALLGPVCPTPAPKIGEMTDPVRMYLSDIYTTSANLAGLPAMSLPQGFSSSGLPIGAQLVGNRFEEAKLLSIAHAMQQASDFHKRRPQAA